MCVASLRTPINGADESVVVSEVSPFQSMQERYLGWNLFREVVLSSVGPHRERGSTVGSVHTHTLSLPVNQDESDGGGGRAEPAAPAEDPGADFVIQTDSSSVDIPITPPPTEPAVPETEVHTYSTFCCRCDVEIVRYMS